MIRSSKWQRRLNCRAAGKLLQAYLDAELRDTSALQLADHLDECRRCGLEAAAYRWLVDSLTRLAPPVDPDRLERLRSFADRLATTA